MRTRRSLFLCAVFLLAAAPRGGDVGQRERSYAWSDESGSVVAFGTIPAGATSADVDAIAPRKVFLSIATPDDDQPLVTLQVADSTWQLREPAALRVLKLPLSVTTVIVTAPRHRPVRLTIPAEPRDRLSLGRVTLERYPMLVGRVVAAENGMPLSGASIERGSGASIGTTGANGEFEIDIDAELAADWPKALHVRAAGRGTKLLSLAAVPQPRRWDRIDLSTGGSVRVRVSHVEAAADVMLELRRHRGGGPDAWETIARGSATPGGDPVVFSDLDSGKYLLVATGAEPLEQLARDVELRSAETSEVQLDIVPLRIRIAVEHGTNRVPEAKLVVGHNNEWTADVIARGVWESTLWQRGELTAFVTVRDRGTYHSRKSVTGDSDVEWLVQIPDRAIHGRVADRQTGKPVSEAVVALQTPTSTHSTKTDAGGAYRFDFLKPEQYTVRVLPTGTYLPTSIDFPLNENDRTREVNFSLVAATLARLRFVTSSGQPAANAKVYDETQPDTEYQADETGELTLRLAKEERRRIIAVPWQGAMTVVDLAPPHDEKQPRVIRLQDGPATLTVIAKDDEGLPVNGIWYRLRYNGIPLPEDVLLWIAARDGNPFATGSDGASVLSGMPLGVYELWPVTSPKQARAGAPTDRAPVRFTAQPGDNPVRLTFARW